MAKNAVALIIAGSGEVSKNEVNDLILDRWPEDDNIIDLVVPVNKSLYTDTVDLVVDWFDDDKNVYTFKEKDEALSRKSSRLGDGEAEEVDKFSDVFNPDDFKDWDETVFLVAFPDDPEDPDYDLYAEHVEAALEAGFPVYNLCRGLDDVRLEPDNADPEPDPEPEPEEPPKRSRRKRTEDKTEKAPEKDTEPAEESQDPPVQEREERRDDRLAAAHHALKRAHRFVSTYDALRFTYEGRENNSPSDLTQAVTAGLTALEEYISGDVKEKVEAEKATEEKPAEKKRGRGRPRTHFEVAQVWDEEDEEWVARPAGRLAKGTKWRKIHAETDEVLDEGTA